jgi:K+-transporting ATPase c subunit
MKQAAITNDEGATAAVEFALVLPVLIILIVGILYSGLVMYSIAGLHNAVETAARCYSVDSNQCGSASAAETFGESHYYGISAPTFSAAIAGCGHQVSASLNMALSAGITSWNIPLSATACYP